VNEHAPQLVGQHAADRQVVRQVGLVEPGDRRGFEARGGGAARKVAHEEELVARERARRVALAGAVVRGGQLAHARRSRSLRALLLRRSRRASGSRRPSRRPAPPALAPSPPLARPLVRRDGAGERGAGAGAGAGAGSAGGAARRERERGLGGRRERGLGAEAGDAECRGPGHNERMNNVVDGLSEYVAALRRDGVTALPRAFSRAWAEQMREDMMTAFWEAIQRPGGAVGRGPRRWYVEVHPQAISGFVDLVTHPWVAGVCEAVLGPAYQIVEIGFDTPFQGAKYQPWHRDFPSPPETYRDGRVTSLAFNLTGVDVTEDMGPFEIAPGTHYDDGRGWKHEMFPPEELWPRYAERGVRKYPKMGDVSCRSALTVHRGTAHPSPVARPVLVLGVDAPGAGHAALHDMMVTRDFYDALPAAAREHLVCRVVDELVPVTQKHDIEGLVMGVDPGAPAGASMK
jgi:hypothetical protein